MTLLLALLGCDGAMPIRQFPGDTGPVETDVADDTDSVDDTDDTDDTEPASAWVLYPADRVHSPTTPFVADRLADIASADGSLQDDVFMKVGASSTVSSSTLHCFAGSNVDLGDHDALGPTLDYYLAGDAAGSTPFDRDTVAAESGRHAGWVVAGDPSPLEREIDAIRPRLALVHYGANDMGWGSTYADALDLFFVNMSEIADELQQRGIVPMLTGISRRGDSTAADRWVDAFNATIRGIAQDRQVPFVDLELATRHLDGYGLASDGLHLESYAGGACVLTAAGLEHGYNVRNLIVLEALDRAHRALDLGDAPDGGQPLTGDGSATDPWRIDGLPFAHVADTAASPHADLDVYDGCDATQDESGPEWTYRLTLAAPTALRLAVADLGDADVDVHLLDAGGSTAGCIARGHRVVEGTLAAGTYTVVLDSWVDGGEALAGEYLLAAVACLPDDAACAAPLD